MNTRTKIVIPARYSSTRFPGKPLALIAGEPMILRVVERAVLAGIGEVIVATDDDRIRSLCEQNSIHCVITRSDHLTGTDRLSEVVDILQWEDDTIVVNLQGDEPLMPPSLLQQVATLLSANNTASIATLCTEITKPSDVFNPNIVKVVTNKLQQALYFSRAAIPFDRDTFAADDKNLEHVKRHLGIYAYRAAFLRQYPELNAAPIEQSESLEQLRALWHGYQIVVGLAEEAPGPGVDTPEDVALVEGQLQS